MLSSHILIIDDSLSIGGTEAQVVIVNYLFHAVLCFPATVGYTFQFFASLPSASRTKVSRISAKLHCLTGNEDTASASTRQDKDRGQNVQRIEGKR